MRKRETESRVYRDAKVSRVDATIRRKLHLRFLKNLCKRDNANKCNSVANDPDFDLKMNNLNTKGLNEVEGICALF